MLILMDAVSIAVQLVLVLVLLLVLICLQCNSTSSEDPLVLLLWKLNKIVGRSFCLPYRPQMLHEYQSA